MFDFSRVQRYHIACGYTDMRKQIGGLVAVVELQFRQKLDEASSFLTCGHRADRIKALYWEGNGFVLLYKRLESCMLPFISLRSLLLILLDEFPFHNFQPANLILLLLQLVIQHEALLVQIF